MTSCGPKRAAAPAHRPFLFLLNGTSREFKSAVGPDRNATARQVEYDRVKTGAPLHLQMGSVTTTISSGEGTETMGQLLKVNTPPYLRETQRARRSLDYVLRSVLFCEDKGILLGQII